MTESGYEYNVVLIASAFALAANPGDWSFDAALDLGYIHGTAFAIAALVAGVAGGVGASLVGRREAEAAEAPPERQDAEDREGRIIREPAPTETHTRS